MTKHLEQTEGEVLTKRETQAKKPRLFHVILHNDHYTTMDFVVDILETVFHHPPSAALQIMLMVHRSGRGVAGTYTRDIAETKVARVTELARQHGHPLLCTVEPA